MARVTVITDPKGHILGSVRSDPIKIDGGTLKFQKRPADNLKYYELDVAEDMLSHPAERLHEHLGKELKRLNLS
jgi:hypothetical protein